MQFNRVRGRSSYGRGYMYVFFSSGHFFRVSHAKKPTLCYLVNIALKQQFLFEPNFIYSVKQDEQFYFRNFAEQAFVSDKTNPIPQASTGRPLFRTRALRRE